ncbi:MAG: CotH kinase family protein [Lentisphaerae bacterium]|nr:CotH kinase family protein [Lentisphaerota bacterium]
MTHWEERGRDWERLGYMSFFEEGRLRFASGIGLRIHGYKSNRWRRNSFRLYFRSQYGTDHFLPGVLDGVERGPVRTLVLRRDKHHKLLFMNSLAFDVLRRAGVATPRTRPVMTFLNGAYKGVYCLSEHLSRRQWRVNLGHDDFAFYNKRASSDDASIREYRALLEWARIPDGKATMSEAEKRVDLDAMSRQLLVCMFLGLTDWKQGVALRDRTIPGARWSWIAWDLDNSFVDLSAGNARIDWQHRAATLVFGKGWLARGDSGSLAKEADVRRALFCNLWEQCPEYRRTFLRMATDQLNHTINERYLVERWNWYMSTMGAIGAREGSRRQFSDLKSFLHNRHVFLREDLRAYAGAGKVMSCTVGGNAGSEYRIDGYPETGGYRGSYYAGQEISVEPIGPAGKRIASWLVNGQNVPGNNLSIPVYEDTVIEPVLEDAGRVTERVDGDEDNAVEKGPPEG